MGQLVSIFLDNQAPFVVFVFVVVVAGDSWRQRSFSATIHVVNVLVSTSPQSPG